LAVVDSPVSYRSIVLNRFYEVPFSSFVAGVLTAYDLPDLIGCMAPRRVALINLQNQMNQPASEKLIAEELGFPRSVYAYREFPGNLKVSSNQKLETVVDWCFAD
jgi:hypothetical protein